MSAGVTKITTMCATLHHHGLYHTYCVCVSSLSALVVGPVSSHCKCGSSDEDGHTTGREDIQGCQGVHAGVCVGAVELHHERVSFAVLEKFTHTKSNQNIVSSCSGSCLHETLTKSY